MKQKFTITVADIEMNILSEGTAAEVEATVAKVDRRIREICARSSQISKNEAAILSALAFCSECETVQKDINQNDEEYEALRSENAKLADAVTKLDARLSAQKEKSEAAAAAQKERSEAALLTMREKYEGRIEIMKEKYEAKINALKAKLDEMKKADTSTIPVQIAMEIVDESDENAADESESDAPVIETATPAEDAKEPEIEAADTKKEMRGKGKNKVGSMFELLTFNDV